MTVSVVIPAWNAAGTLAAAIESVLAQDRGVSEIVVVDDGSTDGTAEVAASFGPPVRVLRLKNGGVSRARNAGIRASAGEFVAFLDADDLWHRDKLAMQMPRFSDPEVGLVFCDFSLEHADGRTEPSYLAARPLAGEGWIFENYLQSRFLFPSTIVLRRAALDAVGLFDEELRGAEDLELFARLSLHWKVALCREVLVARHEGPTTLSAGRRLMLHGMIGAFERIAEREKGLSGRAAAVLRQQLSLNLLWSSGDAVAAGELRQARQLLWRSLRAAGFRNVPAAARVGVSLLRRSLLRSRARASRP